MQKGYTPASGQKQILGHPVGLFVLFFTEMWERFSYYGMRALLILFLTAKLTEGGWEWTKAEATTLFGWYVMLVYFLPLLGGWIADNYLGHVKSVITGASIITLGHLSLAIADLKPGLSFMFYIGLLLIVIGTGFFKPNMSSIVGKMYPQDSPKKDGAYTIFYMGVNSGAFIGTLLVGWLGENYGWGFGFGLAGIFMLFGLLQFFFARRIFGEAANKPQPKKVDVTPEEREKMISFSRTDSVLAIFGGVTGGLWIIDGLYSVVTRGKHFIPQEIPGISLSGSILLFILSLMFFVILGILRVRKFDPVERDRLIVIFLIAFFVIFFWASFEQAGTSMTIFARDYTARTLSGHWGMIYRLVDLILSLIPMLILTWIIFLLAKAILKTYPLTVLFTTISFLIIWYLVLRRLYDKFQGDVTLVDTTWFQILNPFFIVVLAPLFSKLWQRFSFSAPQKFALGFFLLGSGFAMLAFGALAIPKGASTASVSMFWLVMAYLLHTMGELAISPVGLSYVSKLAPPRMLGFIFGIWYVFTGLAGKLAATMAGYMDDISREVGLSGFFFIFTVVPFLAAVIILGISGKMKKMMHGIT